jgi:asparagine synthase (glutamine-hydrolysing)
MCGILISKSNDHSIINSISHRGIEAKTIETKQGYYLTHHRLPIQTSDGDEWSQPYEINKGIYLLFNGEIFNYPIERFDSDTEYLIDFFRQYTSFDSLLIAGINHIQRWDGFWSIVIYNENTGEIILFTDPLGKKQLYINDQGEICSEIKGLVREDSVIDPVFMGAIHKWGYNHDDRTPFTNVKRLLPNTIFSWQIGSHQIRKTFNSYVDFYIWPKLSPSFPGEDICDHLRQIMWKSVDDRLISKNYPIGVLLSGGLDSAIIGGTLVKMGAKVDWYTIENDEDEYVQACEKEWGISVTRLKYDMNLSDESVIDDLKEIYCKWNETPIDLGSVVPQFNLFKAVKEKSGNRIVISGDGADELFGGYNRINKYDSQGSDMLHELTYYHLPRLDRMSMAHTIELRNPFLCHDMIRFATTLHIEDRTNKRILKEAFRGIVPEEVLNRSKSALKNDHIKKDPGTYREFIIQLYQDFWKEYLIQVKEKQTI